MIIEMAEEYTRTGWEFLGHLELQRESSQWGAAKENIFRCRDMIVIIVG